MHFILESLKIFYKHLQVSTLIVMTHLDAKIVNCCHVKRFLSSTTNVI